jgi:hypothetical protein
MTPSSLLAPLILIPTATKMNNCYRLIRIVASSGWNVIGQQSRRYARVGHNFSSSSSSLPSSTSTDLPLSNQIPASGGSVPGPVIKPSSLDRGNYCFLS